MRKNIYLEYAELNAKIAELENQKSLFRLAILEEMKQQHIDSQSTEYGTFAIASRTTYKFPKAIEDAEKKLKEQKEKLIKEGKLKVAKVTEFINFRGK